MTSTARAVSGEQAAATDEAVAVGEAIAPEPVAELEPTAAAESPEAVQRDQPAEPTQPVEPRTSDRPDPVQEPLIPARSAGNRTPEPMQPSTRTDSLIADLMEAESSARRADLLLQLGRSGDARAHSMIRPWTESLEASVRAAAYEALGRLLERAPDRLEPHLRTGLSDPDARVRRRVVLAAATARGLTPRRLLEPLKEDPDPQVRRVVREVLRQAPRDGRKPDSRPEEASTAEADEPLAHPAGHESNGNSPSVSNRSLRAR